MRSRDFKYPGREIIVIAHNIRSVENVGSIIRSAECFGAQQVVATGYTPNLSTATDGSNSTILPHVYDKLHSKLYRTSVGAIDMIDFCHHTNIDELIDQLKSTGYTVVGLEQAPRAHNICDYQPPSKMALLIGEEVGGINPHLLARCDHLIEIPIFGNKESLNVSVATGIALFSLATNQGWWAECPY